MPSGTVLSIHEEDSALPEGKSCTAVGAGDRSLCAVTCLTTFQQVPLDPGSGEAVVIHCCWVAGTTSS